MRSFPDFLICPRLIPFLTLLLIAVQVRSDRMSPDANPIVADLLHKASAHNADLQRARAELREARARVPQAASLPDPEVILEYMGNRVAGSAQSVRWAQSFPWPGTLSRRRSAAEWQALAWWHEVQAMELDLAQQVRTLHAEHLFSVLRSGLLETFLRLVRQELDTLVQGARTGDSLTALLRTESELESMADELATLAEDQRRILAELEARVGTPLSEATYAPGNESLAMEELLPGVMDASTPWEEWEDRLQRHNPTLQAMGHRVLAARAGIQVARLETRPMWMASAGYRYAIDPAMSMHGQREFMNEAQVMFSMSIPLWRSRNRAVRDEADARFHVAEQTEESTRRLLVARLKSILSQDRDARLRVRLHEEVLVPKVRQVTDATDAAYRSGKATLSDLTDAHRQWLDIHTRLHRARADLAIQKAALDALFGTEITLSQP